MSENNNNKAKMDGRNHNKKRQRVKMIKADPSLPAPRPTKAKKDRATQFASKAIKNIFGAEDGIWNVLAEQAMSGNMKAMEMLMQYQYGKAGEAKTERASTKQAPIIQFVNPMGQPPQVDNTIDITPEEEEDE
jgi:hypothetical protein|tara:strand:- start:1199 stop:1597 length:399 start_codon:yes stop_codon:yes gene_type:complete